MQPDGTLLCYQPYGKAGLLLADLDLDAATGLLACALEADSVVESHRQAFRRCFFGKTIPDLKSKFRVGFKVIPSFKAPRADYLASRIPCRFVELFKLPVKREGRADFADIAVDFSGLEDLIELHGQPEFWTVDLIVMSCAKQHWILIPIGGQFGRAL